MPRLYRESPLNSIWEGSGNVQCLDVLRAMVQSPASVEAFFAEVAEAAGADPRLDADAAGLRDELAGTSRRSRPAPAAWSSGWRWCSRGRCWSATATRRSPTPSAPRGSAATGGAPSAPCRPPPTSAASSTATAPSQLSSCRRRASLPQRPTDLLQRDHAGQAAVRVDRHQSAETAQVRLPSSESSGPSSRTKRPWSGSTRSETLELARGTSGTSSAGRVRAGRGSDGRRRRPGTRATGSAGSTRRGPARR